MLDKPVNVAFVAVNKPVPVNDALTVPALFSISKTVSVSAALPLLILSAPLAVFVKISGLEIELS